MVSPPVKSTKKNARLKKSLDQFIDLGETVSDVGESNTGMKQRGNESCEHLNLHATSYDSYMIKEIT